MQINGNGLLAKLRPEDLDLLLPYLTDCRLRTGQVLYEPGDIVSRCYFPRGASVVSLQALLDNGDAIETAMIGHEGAVGGIVSSGMLPAFARTSVLHGGSFYAISTADLERGKERSAHIGRLFDRYADCLLAQVFQSVACNANHMIEQRAAKWLSAAVARTGNPDITIGQEQFALIMGVGRSYVSRVISRFKAMGLIVVRRGGIMVLDPPRLEKLACACDHLVQKHFDKVLGGTYPSLAQ